MNVALSSTCLYALMNLRLRMAASTTAVRTAIASTRPCGLAFAGSNTRRKFSGTKDSRRWNESISLDRRSQKRRPQPACAFATSPRDGLTTTRCVWRTCSRPSSRLSLRLTMMMTGTRLSNSMQCRYRHRSHPSDLWVATLSTLWRASRHFSETPWIQARWLVFAHCNSDAESTARGRCCSCGEHSSTSRSLESFPKERVP
mmetsp:Transcript_51851/g.159785  ORF Transcript_51851/g.159785 Transcript_51851/m.159785 type:complete len:201 (+) Transcript_51851:521-1123(+)